MKPFKYSSGQIEQLNAAAGERLDGYWLTMLEQQCEEYIDRVHMSRSGGGADRSVRIRNFEEVLRELPLCERTEKSLDDLFTRFLSSNLPPMKSMAAVAVSGRVDWVDYNRYIARREIRQLIKMLEFKSAEEVDAAYRHKLPRNDLFVGAFLVWTDLKNLPPATAPISDPLETPAQRFIKAATLPALKLGHDHLGGSRNREYPDGKTIVAAIRAFQSTKKRASEY
ncbi:hypothetical protein [Nitratireductor sp.]|uniref:hypothetical protein n=1 Tax=Nitratireductor sp. TaxID=1872084 RepID=UPI0025E06DAA|nr:hypothetical protein [Nitratireductor sp.]